MNSHTYFLFSCLVIFLITPSVYASTSGNETDYQALLQFKSMITNEALTSWNASSHFCDWSGISCGKRHRRVTYLNLSSQGLEGSLSPYVGNLSFLRALSLQNNNFQGMIPHELSRLSKIRFLKLGHNNFSGPIPTNLSSCSNIEVFGLRYNKLVGSIPIEIGFLSKLTHFVVDHNELTGGIPLVLGNLTSMEVFSATGNKLGGSIPDTLGYMKSLTRLGCDGCNLYGTIPHSIYNLSFLTFLSLSGNQLTGSLLPATGAVLPNLVYLQIWGNQLNGLLSPSISNCSKLRVLVASDNYFSGKLTVNFAKLNDISYISLANSIYGSREANDMNFIDTLKNCSSLKMLSLYNCNFQGTLPTSIGNLSEQLRFLNLGRNQLYGHIPSSIGNLVGLTTLVLEDNRFTGKISSTIGKLQNLQIAILDRNNFSGPIPIAIGNLSLLTTLTLSSNKLEQCIPSSLGNCRNLFELDLSRNNLSGSFPPEVGDLKMLTSLDLSENKLNDNIPSSLGGCISLVFLNLRGNSIQGMVPQSLASLRGVTTLDLSDNKFSGLIPQFLEQFPLEQMDLSFNNFEGEVPVLGVFAIASSFSVYGNSRLCGGLVELGLPKCKETGKHKKRFPLFAIVILIASSLYIILCLVYAWCKKCEAQPTQVLSMSVRFMRVSYSQLLKATNGFSRANLIGEGGFGSVYRGILDHDDRFVAVKVLHLQNHGAHKSFIAECEAWQSIRHRNILKIITSCSGFDFQGNDFKALVYEFMPNGSLHDWLHSSTSTCRLNLLQRINILIDVASALDYLHNQCLSTIVHRDLKPSNVLLDDDMVAHVGDFGLARFLGEISNQNITTGIKGTIGYTPPEYGVGAEMTSSGDVYSFGILLLEVMTRKRPTDNIFNESLNLHKFAFMALPDQVTNVIDDDLLNFRQGNSIATQCTSAYAKKIEECLVSTVKIGVSCSVDSPTQRMNMENVVHELHQIMDTLQNI